MTVTYIDVPGPLTNTSEPIDFTTDTRAVSISVEFNPTLANGARECVFDGTDDDGLGGDFAYAYRNSTITGEGPYTYSIRRTGRWPSDFRIRVKEHVVGGDPPPPSTGPSYEPILDPEAWWVLDPLSYYYSQWIAEHDAFGTRSDAPGPMLGTIASSNLDLVEDSADAVWQTSGGVTWTGLVNMTGSAASVKWLIACENDTDPFPTWWKFGVTVANKPCYGVNNGVASEFIEFGAADCVPTAGWHVFTFLRAGDGVTLEFYVDGTLTATGLATMTAAGSVNAKVRLGKDWFAASEPHYQMVSALWPFEFIADDIETLAAHLLGS